MRDKPHILFLGEKWCDCNPECGISNASHIFWGSLQASGLATFEKFHFDQFYYQHNERADNTLISYCEENKPSLIFFTWMHTDQDHWNPSRETLFTLREKLQIPIVTWWGDVQNEVIVEAAETLAPYVDFHILAEPKEPFFRRSNNSYKYITLPHPKDPRIFYDKGLARDIDISFTGGIKNRPEREQGISFLKNSGINIVTGGGQRESMLSIEEYAEIYQRSLIAINFCDYPVAVANGRVFESTMCGALLLDSVHSNAKLWLKPDEEYVTYRSKEEMLEKVRYYLEHRDEATQIAERGNKKAIANHDGKVFWSEVLDKIRNDSGYKSSEAIYANATARINSRDADKALSILVPHAHTKTDAKFYHLVGRAYDAKSNFKQAREYYTKALDAESFYKPAVISLSLLHEKWMNFNESLQLLHEAIGEHPEDEDFLIRMADCFYNHESYSESLKLYKQVISLNGKSIPGYVGAIKILLKTNNFHLAEKIFRIAPVAFDIEMFDDFAGKLEELGKSSEAKQYRSLARHPDTFRNRHGMELAQTPFKATIQVFRGEKDGAKELLKDAMKYQSSDIFKKRLESLQN